MYADRIIHKDLAPERLDQALESLVSEAKNQGFAVGFTRPYPIVLEKIQNWAKKLPEIGVQLNNIAINIARDCSVIFA